MEKTINSKDETFSDKVHDKVNKWMEKLDDYQVQLSLGKMEAKDEFEKGKKELREYFQKYAQTAKRFEHVAEEELEKINGSISRIVKEFQKDEETTEKTIAEHKNAISKLANEINDKI